MTIDSTYRPYKRQNKDDSKYYYEFETSTDSEVEVWIELDTGERIKALNVSGENE